MVPGVGVRRRVFEDHAMGDERDADSTRGSGQYGDKQLQCRTDSDRSPRCPECILQRHIAGITSCPNDRQICHVRATDQKDGDGQRCDPDRKLYPATARCVGAQQLTTLGHHGRDGEGSLPEHVLEVP